MTFYFLTVNLSVYQLLSYCRLPFFGSDYQQQFLAVISQLWLLKTIWPLSLSLSLAHTFHEGSHGLNGIRFLNLLQPNIIRGWLKEAVKRMWLLADTWAEPWEWEAHYLLPWPWNVCPAHHPSFPHWELFQGHSLESAKYWDHLNWIGD